MRGHAIDGANIQPVLELAQAVVVCIDDRNIVGFSGQMLGERSTHLAGTGNDDFHSWKFPLFG